MTRVSTTVREGRKALKQLDLLKILRSEISHEQSSDHFKGLESGYLGDFTLAWDSPQTQDVVLRKRCEPCGEIAVSAILHPVISQESILSREALMKVCIKKPGLTSILQFDCGVSSKSIFKSSFRSDFDIRKAYYLQSTDFLGPSVYRGPSFRSLDPDLQGALKQYLVIKGIDESLTNFILLHLHKKEQVQYLNWLRKLETMVANGESM